MSGKSPGLELRIAEEIRADGPIGFDRFMGLALYDPQGGYYSAAGRRVGKAGDFFTNVSIGPVYGEVLAGQFVEMWRLLGEPGDFTIIEQGADDGTLASDVLAGLDGTPLAGAPFVILEPSPALRERQAARLSGRAVEWYSYVEEMPETRGVHFSNELFDAIPVSLLRSDGKRWIELRVGLASGGFCWVEAAPEGVLADAAASLPARERGFTTEVCTGFDALLRPLAQKLAAGYLLAVDYGMTADELLAPHRRDGTLRCYREHRRDDNPLEAPGTKDITAHVDFSRFARAARAAGWNVEKFTDQHHFLVGAATRMLLEMDGAPDPARLRPLMTLLHPENMGRQFQAILLSKGAFSGGGISGFQHARDSDIPG